MIQTHCSGPRNNSPTVTKSSLTSMIAHLKKAPVQTPTDIYTNSPRGNLNREVIVRWGSAALTQRDNSRDLFAKGKVGMITHGVQLFDDLRVRDRPLPSVNTVYKHGQRQSPKALWQVRKTL